MSKKEKYLTISRLKKIPWLVHGFGLASFTPEDLKEDGKLASFQTVEMKQEHSSRVYYLEGPPADRLAGDGLVTGAEGLLLIIKTADCLPVFLIDIKNRVVAAVHCGWRSTYLEILLATVNLMKEKFSSQAENLLAALGPCIEKDCYEVGLEIFENFSAAGFKTDFIFWPSRNQGRFYLDLRKANWWFLVERLGLKPENIFQLNQCTFCQPGLHSFRRNKEKSLRLINFIGIQPQLMVNRAVNE
ncbi:MAG: peptidoglycan editing factor PgeF [Acidobacteriota bacterium]|nr:peptidoglycan editing factor PgeF [Acidobacteriota bacterium]MDW3229695.1 peptidoglycan editing factor PgeF [Acidobacteriota bacterium]